MSGGGILRMADILPPSAPAEAAQLSNSLTVTAVATALLLALLLALALALLAWRRYRHSPTRLARSLRRGHIGAREAAHRLAHLFPTTVDDDKRQRRLDRLRFRRQPPTAAEVLALMREFDRDA